MKIILTLNFAENKGQTKQLTPNNATNVEAATGNNDNTETTNDSEKLEF